MQDEWWYSVKDARKGPVSTDVLRAMFVARKISEATLVWKQGQTNWVPLSELPDLQKVIGSVPPELPIPDARERAIALPFAGPWRRFFARFIDLWALALPTAFLIAFALSHVSLEFRLWIQRPGSDYAFGWLVTPIILLCEVGIFAIFGNTLGKALLSVKVTTVDAQRPTAGQYLRRQFGVYWFGLGTGFPIVSLFAMASQHARLKSGRQTRYDEGKFNVKASKLGVVRPLASVAVVAALVVGNGLLQQMSNASDRNYYRGTTWLNAATGKSVAIPSGWIHQQQTNDDKQPISIWSGPGYGATVVFAKEDVPLELDLKSYLNAWVEAVKANLMLLSPGAPTLVGAREGFTIEGTLSNDRTHRVRATLVKKGGHVWRVVILANSGKNPASEQSMKLQTLLFQSIE